MTAISIVFLAFAMSTDAFAAAIGKGAVLSRPSWREALKTGLIFGTIEAMTPVVGWALGSVAADYVTSWDHWIAFGLLSILGLKMVVGSFMATEESHDAKPTSNSIAILALTGLATSIDAMAIGVGLAFVDTSIWVAALAIGAATTLMVTLGVMVGRAVGPRLGRWAEGLGGLILIAIGTFILVEHLSAT